MALVKAWSVDAGFVNNASLSAQSITAGHAITVWASASGDTITGLTDSVGTNTYVAHPSSPQTITGGTTVYAFRCLNHSGGAAVVISTLGGTGGQKGMVAAESSGRSQIAIDNSTFAATGPSNTQTGSSFSVAANADILAADLLTFTGASVTWTASSGFAVPAGGTVAGSVSMPVCLENQDNVTAGSYTASFTNNATNRGIIFSFSLPTAPGTLGDGGSTGSTTAVTGTNGTGMSAILIGQQLDVLLQVNVGTSSSASVADNLGNTYVQIDHQNQTGSHGYDLYRFRCTVTSGGTPVITGTYGASPVAMNIGVAILTGIDPVNPFTSGTVSTQFQVNPSGTNSQSSGTTPTLFVQPALICAWSFTAAKANASSAGTGFTQIGTGFANLGSACMTYETKTVNTTVGQAATFTPNATNTVYTMAAAFNLLGGAPAYPFRRKIRSVQTTYYPH